VKDLKTNEWSGFNYDVLKQVTERLELNLVFSQPTGWGMVTADLLARKFDVMCTGYWVHPHMAKYVLFSRPFAFQPVFLAVRADDQRFKVGVNLNDPNLTMVALDGDNPVNIAKADFPKAKILALPNTTNFSDVLISVETKKADFTIVDPHTFGAYNEKNPGKMKILVDRPAMRIYPVSYIFRAEDYVLRDAVNIALEEMILDGSMDKIFDQYNQYDHGFYRAVVPMVNPYKVKK
jgi:ABC-type amino acid transport substrate-binding protein